MSFDINGYKKAISANKIWRAIFIFGIAYALYSIFSESIAKYWVDSFLCYFPQTGIANILCIATIIFAGLRIRNALKFKLLPTPSSLIFITLSIFFYLVVIRFNNLYRFYGWGSWGLPWLKYSDILFLFGCLVSLEFRSFSQPMSKTSYYSLIADEPDPDQLADLIQNGSYVERIAHAVNETASKVSYSIGVFASWGAGKTDFLIRLKALLKENIKENVVLEFNPWKAASPESILEDFFTLLSSGLKPYNKSIVAKIKAYSKKILSTGKEIQYRIADALLDELIKDESLQERYLTINDAIKSTGKRFVVVIDDLDRMTGIEVMQVLRIIRNSANFANTFFVVALDHEYVSNVLQKTELFAKEEQYLKKIFQLIITLPQIRKDTFGKEILNLLVNDDMSLEDKDKIEKAVSSLRFGSIHDSFWGIGSAKHERYLEKMLENYRDIKRFCNSFKLNFGILKNEVEVIDLFLLELIKAKSFFAYESIANRNLLDITKDEPRTYTLNKKGWEEFEKAANEQMNPNAMEGLKEAISYLLEKSNVKNQRQFAYPYNFYLYFCYQLFNLISLEEFQKAIDLPWNELSGVFDNWILEGKQSDLSRILDNVTDFRYVDQFEKFMKVYILKIGILDFHSRANKMVMDIDKNINQYFKEKDNYANFIRKMLSDTDLPELNKAMIAHELMKNSIYRGEDLLLPRLELQELIYSLFDSYLLKRNEYDHQVYEFYLLNDNSRTRDNHIILYPKAHDRMESFLQISSNFEGFLRYLIRSYQIPTDGYFVFAPFTKDIFKDWSKFKTLVEKHISSDKTINELKKIIIPACDIYIGGEDRFYLEGEELSFVLDHLRRTKQYPL